MERQLPLLAVVATTTEGSDLPGREENFPQIFGRVARTIWPRKTAFILAQIGGASDRAAKDWLSGKVPPPAIVITAIMVELTKRSPIPRERAIDLRPTKGTDPPGCGKYGTSR